MYYSINKPNCVNVILMKNDDINALLSEFTKYKNLHLNLNMTRGKPCPEQLDLNMQLLDVLNSTSNLLSESGVDYRNYGVVDGIDECKGLIGDIFNVNPDNVLIYGNSSLHIMYEQISRSYTHGVLGSTPWCKLDKKVKWLCPVPGYDRHFAITEYFDIEMINIPLNYDGPDMDLVEEYVKDPLIKGIWCVPQYSNPSGITYSDEVVKRLARLKPSAKDFRIYWDDAYIVHHLYDEHDQLLDIMKESLLAGNPNLVYTFFSTNKISFPGSGVSALIASEENIKEIRKQMSVSTIGYDKLNQLRHVKFFINADGIKKHMKKHAEIIRPKFELVERILEEELKDVATWSKPKGGYFISLEVPDIAKQVIDRCKVCGVILTDAGAAFPYHLDPNNSNIRISPTYPNLKELELATKILCLSVKIEYSLLNKSH